MFSRFYSTILRQLNLGDLSKVKQACFRILLNSFRALHGLAPIHNTELLRPFEIPRQGSASSKVKVTRILQSPQGPSKFLINVSHTVLFPACVIAEYFIVVLFEQSVFICLRLVQLWNFVLKSAVFKYTYYCVLYNDIYTTYIILGLWLCSVQVSQLSYDSEPA